MASFEFSDTTATTIAGHINTVIGNTAFALAAVGTLVTAITMSTNRNAGHDMI
jgi:hypothetical protein